MRPSIVPCHLIALPLVSLGIFANGATLTASAQTQPPKPTPAVATAAPTPAKSNFLYLDDEAEAGGFDLTAVLQKLPASFIIAQQENGDGYLLTLNSNSVELGVRRKGAVQPLATVQTKIFPGSLIVQRRGLVLRVLNANRTVLQAEDGSWQEGKIGYMGGIKDAKVQPVEDIFFDDDFMRIKAEVALAASKDNPHNGIRIADVKSDETIWKAVAGKWTSTGLSENDQAQVSQSANAFAFQATGNGTNLALAGRPFWNDYTVETSARPEGSKAIGLVAYAQDPNNYLILHWTSGDTGKVQLRAVVDGKTRVLDEADGGFDPKQWYRLRLSIARGVVRAWIDDREVVRASTGLFGRGQVGVYTENPSEKETADFDDVKVRSNRNFHDDFSSIVPGRWQTISGQWQMKGAAIPADNRGAFAVMGEPDWNNYVVSSQIQLRPDTSGGLILDHETGKGAYLLRISGSRAPAGLAGKTQIVKLAGGKTTVLAEVKTGNRWDNKGVMWNFNSDHGYLKATANGQRVIDAFDESLSSGRAGVYAQRGQSGAPQMRAFSIEFPDTHATWAKVPELYELEMQAKTMGGWSTPEGFWVTMNPIAGSASPTTVNTPEGTDKAPSTLWHKGTFWGDGTLQFKLPALTPGQNLSLLLDAALRTARVGQAPAKANGNLKLSFQVDKTGDKNTLKVNLVPAAGATPATTKAQTKSGEAKLDGAPNDYIVEVLQRGTFLIVRLQKDKSDKQTTVLATRLA